MLRALGLGVLRRFQPRKKGKGKPENKRANDLLFPEAALQHDFCTLKSNELKPYYSGLHDRLYYVGGSLL